MELKGSRTEMNLIEAYAAESQARNNYTFYASIAKRDGYNQIGAIFEETASNEKEHAELWYKYLNGGDFSDTKANLQSAAEGEHFEHSDMYPRFAREAREEGFEQIAKKFELVAQVEKEHEERYREAAFQRGKRLGFLQGWRRDLAVPELRAHSCGQGSAPGLPRVRARAVLFPAEAGKLLTGKFSALFR